MVVVVGWRVGLELDMDRSLLVARVGRHEERVRVAVVVMESECGVSVSGRGEGMRVVGFMLRRAKWSDRVS